MRRLTAILIVPVAVLMAGAVYASIPFGQEDPRARLFESRVRPILAERCFGCHGPAKQMSGLRLDSRASILKGGERGPAVLPGKPAEGLLVRAVHRSGPLKMPPTGPIPASEIETLTEWIRAGAYWPTIPKKQIQVDSPLWSLQPVRPPIIQNLKSKIQNPIDRFVLAKLREKGIEPALPADRRTLIRRAYFDLIGLPPTSEEIETFMSDKSDRSYEKMVDALLTSPHYGERWGRHWLDVARYTDSLDSRGLGGEGDVAFAWRYRDWVVDAFNRDLPYDRFIAEQIAGDLIPAEKPGEYNRAGVIATGFLAIGNWGNGDADKEKILTDIADDQVDVVSRAFMGLTVACARCHDHKFDPITQRDYYALAGIFFSTHILAKLTPKGEGEKPMRIPLASPQDLERRAQHAERLKALEEKLRTTTDLVYTKHAESMKPQAAAYLLAAWDYANRPAPESDVSMTDFAGKRDLKEYALRQWLEVLNPGGFSLMSTPVKDVLGNAGVHAWKGPGDTPSLTVNLNDTPRAILTFTLPPKSVAVHPGPAHGVVVGWRSPVHAALKLSGRVADADAAAGDGIAWSIVTIVGGESVEITKGEIANGGRQELAPSTIVVRPGDEIQLRILPKNGHTCDTTTVELTIEDSAKGKKWDLTRDLIVDPLSSNPRADSDGNQGVWRFMDMSAGGRGPEAKDGPSWGIWDSAVKEFKDSKRDRSGLEQAAAEFQKSFTVTDARSPFRIRRPEDERALDPPLRDTLAKLRFDLYNLQRSHPPPLEYANGAQEGGVPESPHAGVHDVKIHIRGRYDRLGDTVARGFPRVLEGRNPPRIESGSGRLELARWLASPDHPLTARVMANRIWQHHFGEGIVRTPGNFGRLGEPPANQPLLDYLAWRFREGGWSIKKLHREIMLSDTYRRSSVESTESRKKDPENHLFGRMNRRRLDAESLRDAMLSVTGELNRKAGGPATRDLNEPRRSLYLMTVRSDRSGYGPLFDTPDSTSSVDKRVVSTVAPQALFLLNGPFVQERATALAKRLLSEPYDSDTARLASAYRLLFGRAPKAVEVKIGLDVLNSSGPTTVATESASLERWTDYCHMLLCANEFIIID